MVDLYALEKITQAPRHGRKLGRRSFLSVAIGTAAATGTGVIYQQYDKKRQHDQRIEDLAGKIATATGLLKERYAEAITQLSQHAGAYAITPNGISATNPADEKSIDAALQDAIIARTDSSMMGHFLSQMPEKHAQAARKNVRLTIFSPSLKGHVGFFEQYVGGLSFGSGVIAVSTSKGPERKLRKSPYSLVSAIGHEAEHERNKALKLGQLASEGMAYSASKEIIEAQLRASADSSKNYDLEQALESTNQVLHTARVLSSRTFKGAFDDVYPENVVTAKHLLGRFIPPSRLREVLDIGPLTDEVEIGTEIYAAAEVAYLVGTATRGEAIKRLYSVATDEHQSGHRIINALYGLTYLSPGSVHIEESINPPPRGARLRVAGGEKFMTFIPEHDKKYHKAKIGFSHGSDSTPKFYAYGELPSLQAVLENRPERARR